MGFPGDLTAVARQSELATEPENEINPGRHVQWYEKEDWNQRHDPGAGKQHEIRTHDAGDCPRRSHERDDAGRVHEDEPCGSGNARSQVEKQISSRTEGLLCVVAEDPENPHVSDEVPNTTVEEHRDEHAQSHRLVREEVGIDTARAHTDAGFDFLPVECVEGSEFARNGRPLEAERGSGRLGLWLDEEIDRYGGGNDHPVDKWADNRRIGVAQRNHDLERRSIWTVSGDNDRMDHTSITRRIEDLENSDPAEAAEIADELAVALARLLENKEEATV